MRYLLISLGIAVLLLIFLVIYTFYGYKIALTFSPIFIVLIILLVVISYRLNRD